MRDWSDSDLMPSTKKWVILHCKEGYDLCGYISERDPFGTTVVIRIENDTADAMITERS